MLGGVEARDVEVVVSGQVDRVVFLCQLWARGSAGAGGFAAEDGTFLAGLGASVGRVSRAIAVDLGAGWVRAGRAGGKCGVRALREAGRCVTAEGVGAVEAGLVDIVVSTML